MSTDNWGREVTVTGSGPFTASVAAVSATAATEALAIAAINAMGPPQVPQPPAPPDSVATFRAKMILAETPSKQNAGKMLLDDVNALVSSLTIAQQIAWNDADVFDRTSPLLQQLATQIGLTSSDLDDLFTQASQLVV